VTPTETGNFTYYCHEHGEGTGTAVLTTMTP
jgi:hypothetical protein